MTDKPLEFADDHVVENKTPPPLKVPVKVPVRIVSAKTTGRARKEVIENAIKAMRAFPRNERLSKAGKLENSATVMERIAVAYDDFGDDLILAARELRRIAAALRE